MAGCTAMSLEISLDGKKASCKKNPGTAGELLQALGLSCEEAIVKVGGRAVPESARLATGKKIEVVRVVFGG